MSTAQTQDAFANLKGLPQPKVAELPQIALTGRITRIGEPVVTKEGEGDYDAVELTIEPTNGSRKISFVKMYIRPEYFSFGQLDPEDMYVKKPRNAYFTEIKEGSGSKPKTNGESFAGSFGMNVMPQFGTDKDGNVRLKDGKPFVKRITPVMAIAGGTLEGFSALVGVFKAAVEKNGKPSTSIPGLTELSTTEIVAILNDFLKSSPQVELAFTAKQGYRNGEPTDNYEFDQFQGVFNSETHNRLVARAEKTKDNTGNKKLVIRYQV